MLPRPIAGLLRTYGTPAAFLVAALVLFALWSAWRTFDPFGGDPRDPRDPPRETRRAEPMTAKEEQAFGLAPPSKPGVVTRVRERIVYLPEAGPTEVETFEEPVDVAAAPHGISRLEFCRRSWTAFVLDHADSSAAIQQGRFWRSQGCAELHVDQASGHVQARERRDLVRIVPSAGLIGTPSGQWAAFASPAVIRPSPRLPLAVGVGLVNGSPGVGVFLLPD